MVVDCSIDRGMGRCYVLDMFVCADTTRKHLKEGRKEMFYLTTHSTHFTYGYMASDI